MVTSSRRVVGVAGATLVGSSLVGGVVSIVSGVNTLASAWTGRATLAAPWPMLVVQVAATVAATRASPWTARAGSAVLGLSAALAGISGFFDGQLGRPDLGTGYVVAQVGYVVVAWVTVACAFIRLSALRVQEGSDA